MVVTKEKRTKREEVAEVKTRMMHEKEFKMTVPLLYVFLVSKISGNKKRALWVRVQLPYVYGLERFRHYSRSYEAA